MVLVEMLEMLYRIYYSVTTAFKTKYTFFLYLHCSKEEHDV